MVAGGLTEKVIQDKVVSFSFPDCGILPPPVIMVQHVSFRYGPDKVLSYLIKECLYNYIHSLWSMIVLILEWI